MVVGKEQREGDGKKILWSLKIVALLIPLFLVFSHYGLPGDGRAACISLAMLCIAIKVRPELNRDWWLWAAVGLLVMLHLPIIFLVPWSSKWIPSVVLLPFALVDCLADLLVIQSIEKIMTSEKG